MINFSTGTAIIGAGNLGIATAYYLMRNHGVTDVVLIDQGQPMGFTSAQSGENYRDWWPHPCMVRFMSRSLDLMEEIAGQTDNRIAMTRRGIFWPPVPMTSGPSCRKSTTRSRAQPSFACMTGPLRPAIVHLSHPIGGQPRSALTSCRIPRRCGRSSPISILR
ncbi:FAD-dependent oxidoreductase [Gemmobacter lanyuensis]